MDKLINKSSYTFKDLISIIEILRSDQGCPWDRKQTHETLRETVLEESYEVVEAINKKDMTNLKEELGDLLLHIVLHSQIASEANDFDINDVITVLCEKMIRRHPHVFGNVSVTTDTEIIKNWDAIKQEEKNYSSITEIMKLIPKALPALVRAQKVQKKAAKVNFDFQSLEEAFLKVKEEIAELEEAIESASVDAMEEEFGDTLFSMVNLSRFFGINAEFSLTNAIEKFITRFEGVEQSAKQEGLELGTMTVEELNQRWERIK